MNYLELVKEAIRESGAHLKVPTTVGASEGLADNFEQWVKNSWNEIQLERVDWHFNRDEVQVPFISNITAERATVPVTAIGEEHRNNWKLMSLREVWLASNVVPEDTPRFYINNDAYVPDLMYFRDANNTGTVTASYLETSDSPIYTDDPGNVRLDLNNVTTIDTGKGALLGAFVIEPGLLDESSTLDSLEVIIQYDLSTSSAKGFTFDFYIGNDTLVTSSVSLASSVREDTISLTPVSLNGATLGDGTVTDAVSVGPETDFIDGAKIVVFVYMRQADNNYKENGHVDLNIRLDGEFSYKNILADTMENPKQLYYIPWSHWPASYGRTLSGRVVNESELKRGTPQYITINPKGDLQLYPVPDKKYFLEFYPPKKSQTLVQDSDVPILPEEYHMIIVWRALMDYAMYHEDRSVFEKARSKYMFYKKRLEHSDMPEMTLVVDKLYG